MTKRIEKWQVLDSKLAFDHKWFKVRQDTVRLPEGRIVDDYFMSLGGRIVVVAPITKGGKFILVRQYKHAAAEVLLEFPAGYMDENEAPIGAARRELREETGFDGRISPLTTIMNNPTKEVGEIHLFLAENVVKKQDVNFDENEFIETSEVSAENLRKMILAGEVKVAATITAAYLTFEKIGFIKPM